MRKINKRLIYSAVYLYLSVPVMIFFLGWFKLPFGLVLTAALITPLILCFKNSDRISLSKKDILHLGNSLVVVLILLYLSGIGGFGFQNSDYTKHNAILRDLINHNWPVIYDKDQSMLVYYMAYYLPAALVGKLFGFEAASHFEFIWAFVGMALFAFLFFAHIKKFKAQYLLLFVFFSGMDFIGKILLGNFPVGTEHIEHWSGLFSYQSNITILFWVPQHAIAGWILTVFILKLMEDRNEYIPVVLSLSIFWSPFIFIGLLPIAVYAVFKNGIKRSINPINIGVSACVVIMFGLYYMLNRNTNEIGFIWNQVDMNLEWPKAVLFYALEFGIFGALIFHQIKNQNYKLFVITMTTLCILPLVRFGMYNDLTMRASLPSLLILCLFMIRYLIDSGKNKSIIVSLLICGSLTGLFEISRSLDSMGVKSDAWGSIEAADNKAESMQYVSDSYKSNLFYKLFIKH